MKVDAISNEKFCKHVYTCFIQVIVFLQMQMWPCPFDKSISKVLQYFLHRDGGGSNGCLNLRYGSSSVITTAKWDKTLTDANPLLFYCKRNSQKVSPVCTKTWVKQTWSLILLSFFLSSFIFIIQLYLYNYIYLFYFCRCSFSMNLQPTPCFTGPNEAENCPWIGQIYITQFKFT